MEFLALQRARLDLRAWCAFLLGTVACVLALSYGEMRKEPPGLLVLDVASTQPGVLKILYKKDGVLTDPGLAINFSQGKSVQAASFPLGAGQYELIGFKPLIETGGRVSIKNIKIVSGLGVHDLSADNFVSLNQLEIISSQNSERIIAPALGASDPFGAIPNLQVIISKPPFILKSFLWIAAGKFTLIFVFLMVMYGLSGSLPFARALPKESKVEPDTSQLLGFLAVGMIVLYLRSAHSLFVPVLYAEDGSWSADLINRGLLDMLFNARPDYFVFGNVLLLSLAAFCNTVFFGYNLTYLAQFVSFFSMLFFAMLAVAPIKLLRDALCIEARLLLWLFVLLIPLGNSSFEILGRLNNIGYSFLFLAFCLLVWRRDSLNIKSRNQIIASDVMLFLCANTNPLCYLLIGGAFTIEAWQDWKSNKLSGKGFWLKKYFGRFSVRSGAALLSILFLLGLWILNRVLGSQLPMGGKIIAESVQEIILGRTFLYPIIFAFYTQFNNSLSWAVLIFAVVVVVLMVRGIQRERFILASSFFVILLGVVITILSRPLLTGIASNYRTTFPDRYYYGLTLMVYVVITSALSAGFGAPVSSRRRIVVNFAAGGLIALYAGSGIFLFEFSSSRYGYLPEMSFLDEVKKAYKNRSADGPNGARYSIALFPPPSSAYFPAEYVAATVLGVRSIRVDSIDRRAVVPVRFSDVARIYNDRAVRQVAAGRGREDGWFYVSNGARSWIPDGNWLKQKNLAAADVIEISHEEFAAIPDSGIPVK